MAIVGHVRTQRRPDRRAGAQAEPVARLDPEPDRQRKTAARPGAGGPGRGVSPPPPPGGHTSPPRAGWVGKYPHNIIDFPLTADGYHIDLDRSAELIKALSPKVLILGKSLFLFPEPVKDLSELGRQRGAVILYDAAHVLGLIAGGCLHDPLG